MKTSLGIEAELIPGKGGIFVVNLNGKDIFNKKEIGRYPILGEVTRMIKDLHPEL